MCCEGRACLKGMVSVHLVSDMVVVWCVDKREDDFAPSISDPL